MIRSLLADPRAREFGIGQPGLDPASPPISAGLIAWVTFWAAKQGRSQAAREDRDGRLSALRGAR